MAMYKAGAGSPNFHTVWIIYATFVGMRFGATENGFGVAMVAYSSHPDLNGLGTW